MASNSNASEQMVGINPMNWSHRSSDDSDASTSNADVTNHTNVNTNNTDGLTDNSTSSGNEQIFGADINFEGATDIQWPLLCKAPDEKPYHFKRKEEPGLSKEQKLKFTLPFRKRQGPKLFRRLAVKFNIKEKRMQLHYPLKLSDGSTDWQTIVNDSDLEDCMNIMYSQVEGMSEILVSEGSRVSSRSKRPIEERVMEIGRLQTITLSYYQKTSPKIADLYLKRMKYIQLMMGNSEAYNLLNPLLYICHIPTCMQLVNLRNHSDISSVIDHWKKHKEECCKVIIIRHNYVSSKVPSPWSRDLTITMERLEMVQYAGQPLAIDHLMEGCFFAAKGKAFKGSSMMVDFEVMKKIANYEPDALEGYQSNQLLISNFFQPRSSSTQSSST